MVKRTALTSSYQEPQSWHVQSLGNWLNGTAAIGRRESEFIECKADLACLGRSDDGVVSWLEHILSEFLPHRHKVQ